jgi:hypothetical protein
MKKLLDEATPIPASFRDRQHVALDRSLAFVERVAAADVCYLGVKRTFQTRRRSSALRRRSRLSVMLTIDPHQSAA